jgi:hypothetical protein
MSYEEKYKKYKEKYLNLLNSINLLKGGDKYYDDGCQKMDAGNILGAIEDFKRSQDKLALSYLFDIYYFGRIGIARNFVEAMECKKSLETKEQKQTRPYKLSIGIDLMIRCFPFEDFFLKREDIPPLIREVEEHKAQLKIEDLRVDYLRYFLSKESEERRGYDEKKRAALGGQRQYELSLFLKAEDDQNLHDTLIPAQRGIAGAAFLRGKLLLNFDGRPHMRVGDMESFKEARSWFKKIIGGSKEQDYTDKTNKSLEAAYIFLRRMQVHPPSDFWLEQPIVLEPLKSTDSFVFDISNIDHPVKYTAFALCSSLLRTGAAGEFNGRRCILGQSVGSFEGGQVPTIPIQDALFFRFKEGEAGEEPIVDTTVALALGNVTSDSKIAMLDSIEKHQPKYRPRIFLFCGDGNSHLETLVCAHDFPANKNPNSIYSTFEKNVLANPDIDFKVVCARNRVSQRYLELQREGKVQVLTISQFIVGCGLQFKPTDSFKLLRQCLLEAVPDGWKIEQVGQERRFINPSSKSIYYTMSNLNAEIPETEPPIGLNDRLLRLEIMVKNWYEGGQKGKRPAHNRI